MTPDGELRAYVPDETVSLMTDAVQHADVVVPNLAELGILTSVYDGDATQFMTKIMEYAKQFCPPNKASKAVGNIKRACQSGAEVPFSEALAIERELQQQLFQSEDAKEGIGAYVGKRKPNFSGR